MYNVSTLTYIKFSRDPILIKFPNTQKKKQRKKTMLKVMQYNEKTKKKNVWQRPSPIDRKHVGWKSSKISTSKAFPLQSLQNFNGTRKSCLKMEPVQQHKHVHAFRRWYRHSRRCANQAQLKLRHFSFDFLRKPKINKKSCEFFFFLFWRKCQLQVAGERKFNSRAFIRSIVSVFHLHD